MYDNHTKASAKRLWLEGGITDAEIAAKVGVVRPDTIRDWRVSEDWDPTRASSTRSLPPESATGACRARR